MASPARSNPNRPATSIEDVPNPGDVMRKGDSFRVPHRDGTADQSEEEVLSDFHVRVHGNDKSGNDKNASNTDAEEDSKQVLPRESDHEPSNSSSKRKRGNIRSRIAVIEKPEARRGGLRLPVNQYECKLVRRAVKPLDPDKRRLDEEEEGIYGDIALGMKLSVADTGQVIVQNVTSLGDGRASPAQLTGKINRGDILLFIDGVGLAENALLALNRLKAPVDKNVPCQREYTLRFAAGEGHRLLETIERNQAAKKLAVRQDPASEMLTLFPMVDQLSGMPLFEEEFQTIKTNAAPKSPTVKETRETLPEIDPIRHSLNDLISNNLANDRVTDRNLYIKEWLRSNPEFDVKAGTFVFENGFSPEKELTLAERQDLGRKAVSGIKNMLRQVEDIDAGKDTRSFQSWNTTLSLYSRASTRRKRVLDAASLPASFARVQEEEEEDDDSDAAHGGGSVGSNSDDQSEQLDGDELLLRLAARDEIWRKQVIEFLEKVGKEEVDPIEEPMNGEDVENVAVSRDMDTALSNELGNFLFGANMTKVLAKNKTPRALPSEEVTAVLFDLATRLSATVPDEIKASGSIAGSRAGLTPFESSRRQYAGDDFDLATRFLLDDALPAWLASFKPLAWEHRRILWPTDRARTGGSTTASTLSDDSLTVDSGGHSLQTSRSRKRRTIREIIEDNELNPETRGETCFLSSFYFIHSLMPRLMNGKSDNGANADSTMRDIRDFLEKFGSYLRIDTCLAYAAAVRAESVVDILLGVAKHDPRHREVIKQTSKQATMVFYEPTMLSAVLQLLQGINTATDHRRLAIIDLSVSAYPDIRPWQVEQACNSVVLMDPTTDSVPGEDLYYRYMSLLLHPTDGHGGARRKPTLVEEFCSLSVERFLRKDDGASSSHKMFRSNFLSVASRASSHHLVYYRDLSRLLGFSMKMKEYSLALDLVGEILDDESLSKDTSLLERVRDQLRIVGRKIMSSKLTAPTLLRRVLRLYGKPSFRDVYSVHEELLGLLEYVSKGGDDSDGTHPALQLHRFLQFLSEEAQPLDLLTALTKHQPSPDFQPEIVSILHTILSRGTADANELSSSLLQIQQARQQIKELKVPQVVSEGQLSIDSDHSAKQTIWKLVEIGMVEVEK